LTRANKTKSRISAVDLFCGAGGLTFGLRKAGIRVDAGIDIDPTAEFPYTANNLGSEFHRWDLSEDHTAAIRSLFADGHVRLLAGCAPCQPFSKLTNGIKRHASWNMLNSFGRLARAILPELITMENVPELAKRGETLFKRFIRTLDDCGYFVDWKVVLCSEYGAPQARRRLVLVASRLGPVSVPLGRYLDPADWRTVRDTIATLPALASGEQDPSDALHVAAQLSPINIKRIRATPRDGGSRNKWPAALVLACHRRASGARYHSIYGRMWWDNPAPTMTTLCTGIGNGRFGHPEQDRAITLREAALLQSFPLSYKFWPPEKKLNRAAVSRMIGNAVPPILGEALGTALVKHVRIHGVGGRGRPHRGRSPSKNIPTTGGRKRPDTRSKRSMSSSRSRSARG